MKPPPLSPGTSATLACLYEATAPKPGNVHPHASFGESTAYAHFVQSAVVIGPVVARAKIDGVGPTIRAAVEATRAAVGTNTNLGVLLLIVPLAAVGREASLRIGIANVLARLDDNDTQAVYEAIHIAEPGGIGSADAADVASDPPAGLTLFEAMRLASERDRIAWQYVNDFEDVFRGADRIAGALADGLGLSDAIVQAHLAQMSAAPDSLIARKCGAAIAAESATRAAKVLRAGEPGSTSYSAALGELDQWLRADGNRRNPGTTADLVGAGLFVLLREGRLDGSKWD